eukprot:gene21366-28305_t
MAFLGEEEEVPGRHAGETEGGGHEAIAAGSSPCASRTSSRGTKPASASGATTDMHVLSPLASPEQQVESGACIEDLDACFNNLVPLNMEISTAAGPEGANCIADFLEDKHIIVTGGSGLCAKVVIHKLLSVQPHIGSLSLVLRSSSKMTAEDRLEEIIESPLLQTLSMDQELLRSKFKAVEGDLVEDNLGIEESLRQDLQERTNIVFSCAASTDFDITYDDAIKINTLGAQKMVEFASTCSNLCSMVHVSAAYVNGHVSGLVDECTFAHNSIDVDYEIGLALGALESNVDAMERVELGTERARLHGWNNTYTFTKSMGEMLVTQMTEKHGLPLSILRPSIVTSALEDPLPGWIEGCRMADPIIMAYGQGKFSCFVSAR